jgi:hypothetical protein
VNFDKRYWIFIGTAMLFATIASGCTIYLSLVFHTPESNSLAAVLFDRIGMIPGMLLGVVGLLPLMFAVPYILRQNERIGLLSMLILGGIVAYTAFDAVNDVSAVLGFQHTYLLAHTVLDTTNNISGTLFGTGSSRC